jgi:hypothetical protein
MTKEVLIQMKQKLTPRTYLEKYYPESGFCNKTVINWIKKGKLKGEQTPTGRWLVVVHDQEPSKINSMLAMLEAAGE